MQSFLGQLGITKMNKAIINLPTHKIAEFCKKNHIIKLSLFGSVLRDDFQIDSDIDFLVEMEPGRSLFDLGGLLYELCEYLGMEVDVVTPL